MAYNRRDDDLAYGDYHDEGGDGDDGADRGLVGDMGRRLFGGRKQVREVPTKCPFVPVYPVHTAYLQLGKAESRAMVALCGYLCSSFSLVLLTHQPFFRYLLSPQSVRKAQAEALQPLTILFAGLTTAKLLQHVVLR
jgi:hypothetical protein